MLCSLLRREFLGFFGIVMGCFFGCFRIQDDRRRQPHLVLKPVPSKSREPVVSRNRLSSLLQAEDNDGLPCSNKEDPGLRTPKQDNEGKKLRDEVRFLKSCGTILQTPEEIRTVSEKLEDASHHDEAPEPLRFHSWLPNTSIEKLNMEKQPDQPPTPIKFGDGWVKGSEHLEHTPSSYTQLNGGGSATDEASSTRTNSGTPINVAASKQCRNKSVRFECVDDVALFSSSSSSSEIAGHYSKKQFESAGIHSVSKPSPYPTPLKLTDEMQTPGTIFPAYLDGMANGKNPRIRSQYVYSVLNPVENISQLKLLEEQSSFERADALKLKSEARIGEASVEKEQRVEASLSSWLKPPSTNQEGNGQHSTSAGKAHLGRTLGDRPIIGLVAAHWNEEESSHISPKYWDGNGIPNSTNKYKEDQKVSWHATPFEERLEKALSDETSITLRKDINQAPPIDFEDTEENDTALSQLQPSTYFKPMVSF